MTAPPTAPALDPRTQLMVRTWLAQHGGEIESLARWMSASLRIGCLRTCREMIAQAMTVAAR